MSTLSVLAALRAPYESDGASCDLRRTDYLRALDDVREALLADVHPADNAVVVRDLLTEAMGKGMTPAAFLLAMFGSPLDRVLERSLDGLTRDAEKRLLRALRHREYQRRKDTTYTNVTPPEEPWYEAFAREIVPQVTRCLGVARADGTRLRIDVRGPGSGMAGDLVDRSGGFVSRSLATLYADPVDATVDGICRVVSSRLIDALGPRFDGQVRLNFSRDGSSGERYGSIARTIVHGFLSSPLGTGDDRV